MHQRIPDLERAFRGCIHSPLDLASKFEPESTNLASCLMCVFPKVTYEWCFLCPGLSRSPRFILETSSEAKKLKQAAIEPSDLAIHKHVPQRGLDRSI